MISNNRNQKFGKHDNIKRGSLGVDAIIKPSTAKPLIVPSAPFNRGLGTNAILKPIITKPPKQR
jgi:hypothetical protein